MTEPHSRGVDVFTPQPSFVEAFQHMKTDAKLPYLGKTQQKITQVHYQIEKP